MSTVRRASLLVFLCALVAAPLQATAGTHRSTLRCSWSGIVHAYDDYEGTVTFDIVSGHGRCTFDGTGPYVITSMQGHGENFALTRVHVSVRYSIRNVNDGRSRSFVQRWDDHALGGSLFVITESAEVPARGYGSADVPYSTIENPDEPFDAPASFGWTFLKAQR